MQVRGHHARAASHHSSHVLTLSWVRGGPWRSRARCGVSAAPGRPRCSTQGVGRDPVNCSIARGSSGTPKATASQLPSSTRRRRVRVRTSRGPSQLPRSLVFEHRCSRRARSRPGADVATSVPESTDSPLMVCLKDTPGSARSACQAPRARVFTEASPVTRDLGWWRLFGPWDGSVRQNHRGGYG